jgi:hypothetical protein
LLPSCKHSLVFLNEGARDQYKQCHHSYAICRLCKLSANQCLWKQHRSSRQQLRC